MGDGILVCRGSGRCSLLCVPGPLEVDRREMVQPWMAVPPVVDPLNEADDLALGLLDARERKASQKRSARAGEQEIGWAGPLAAALARGVAWPG